MIIGSLGRIMDNLHFVLKYFFHSLAIFMVTVFIFPKSIKIPFILFSIFLIQ